MLRFDMFIANKDNCIPTIFENEFYISDLELTEFMPLFICDVPQYGADSKEVILTSTYLIGDLTKLCKFAASNKISKTYLISPKHLNLVENWTINRLRAVSTAFYRANDTDEQLNQIFRFEIESGDHIEYDLSGLKPVGDVLDFHTILTFS